MTYIFTAFYAEAEALIRCYKLKRLNNAMEGLRFDVFANNDIRLVITGTGTVNAAAAVGNAAGVFGIDQNDFIINIGTCCANEQPGMVFAVNKITHDAAGRVFYPDMLVKLPAEEAEVVTVERPIIQGIENRDGKMLYDMEAAAIYQAASLFTGPHRMLFIKVVSDNGNGINPGIVKEVFEMASDKLIELIDIFTEKENNVSEKEAVWMKQAYIVSRDMRCSKVMTDQLLQLFKYLSLCGIDYMSVVDEFYNRQKLPCSSKRDGKVCLDELKKRLL